MATNVNAIKLQNVRNENKQNKGTFNEVLSAIYERMKYNKEHGNKVDNLEKIMPASKNKAKEHTKAFHAYSRVGQYQTRYKKDENGNILGGKASVIKCTEDMVLRYFTKLYNEAVPESAQN